jgi:hypothetical protein
MTTTTWADLDGQNAAHYAAKRRPEWLTEAEEACRAARKRLDDTLDEYGPVALETFDAERAANGAWGWMLDCRRMWAAGMTPASLAGIPPAEEAGNAGWH